MPAFSEKRIDFGNKKIEAYGMAVPRRQLGKWFRDMIPDYAACGSQAVPAATAFAGISACA